MRLSPLARANLTVTWKRCKIGGKLVLITNRKSYFRLAVKLVCVTNSRIRGGVNLTVTYLLVSLYRCDGFLLLPV